MNFELDKKFISDVHNLPTNIKIRVSSVVQSIQEASNLSQISNVKKLAGAPKTYRIRVGDYRIGLYFENETIILARCLPRKDMYRYFP